MGRYYESPLNESGCVSRAESDVLEAQSQVAFWKDSMKAVTLMVEDVMITSPTHTRRATAMSKSMSSKGIVSSESCCCRTRELTHWGLTFTKRVTAPRCGQARGQVVSHWTQPSDACALSRRLKPYADRIGRIVYEAGPTGYSLARHLRSAGFQAEDDRLPRARRR